MSDASGFSQTPTMIPKKSTGKDDELNPEARRVLRQLRGWWWLCLVWHAILLLLCMGYLMTGRAGIWPAASTGFAVAAGLMLILGLPLSHMFRMQQYKRHWRGLAVAPRGYFIGNLAVLAAADLAVTLLALACIAGISGWPLPVIAVVLAYEGFNRPHGQPMQRRQSDR